MGGGGVTLSVFPHDRSKRRVLSERRVDTPHVSDPSEVDSRGSAKQRRRLDEVNSSKGRIQSGVRYLLVSDR